MHQILFRLGQWARPQTHLTALLQHWLRQWGVWGLHHFLKIWVSQFVEICIEIRWDGVGRNSERDRISTKRRLKNASEPSIQTEIAPQPIPNYFFFWGKGGPPDSPPTRAYGARERSPVSPVFRVPPFKPMATSLSTDLLAAFNGPLLRGGGERGKRKGRGKGGRKYRDPPSTFEYNLTASTLSCT